MVATDPFRLNCSTEGTGDYILETLTLLSSVLSVKCEFRYHKQAKIAHIESGATQAENQKGTKYSAWVAPDLLGPIAQLMVQETIFQGL